MNELEQALIERLANELENNPSDYMDKTYGNGYEYIQKVLPNFDTLYKKSIEDAMFNAGYDIFDENDILNADKSNPVFNNVNKMSIINGWRSRFNPNVDPYSDTTPPSLYKDYGPTHPDSFGNIFNWYK